MPNETFSYPNSLYFGQNYKKYCIHTIKKGGFTEFNGYFDTSYRYFA